MRVVKLVCVTEQNNNKFINITPSADGQSFTANWGRVGSNGKDTVYPSFKFNEYVSSKLAKGYTEITELAQTTTVAIDTYKGLDDFSLSLIKELARAAKSRISDNYSVSLDSVTNAQIEKAQEILYNLNFYYNSNKQDQALINKELKQLYTVLPRKMSNTRDAFLSADDTSSVFLKLIQHEQRLLDTLAGQVSTKEITSGKEIDVSKLGLKIKKATKAECDTISKNTDFRLTSSTKVWKVSNKKTEKAFNPKGLATKLLYHGSRTYNYFSILTKGLAIKPNGVPTSGSMFGNGLYSADCAQKSIGYTSISGSRWARGDSDKAYLCVFEVATGKEWDLLKGGTKSYESWMSGIDEKRVKKEGKDSVFCSAGNSLRKNEYVVYNPNQITIRYVIEITR